MVVWKSAWVGVKELNESKCTVKQWNVQSKLQYAMKLGEVSGGGTALQFLLPGRWMGVGKPFYSQERSPNIRKTNILLIYNNNVATQNLWFPFQEKLLKVFLVL